MRYWELNELLAVGLIRNNDENQDLLCDENIRDRCETFGGILVALSHMTGIVLQIARNLRTRRFFSLAKQETVHSSNTRFTS